MRLNNYHLLHKRNQHTNLHFPYSKYITDTEFPEQDTDILGTKIYIKYRSMFDDHEIHETKCKVIRCDKVDPYKMVAMSNDFIFIFVLDSRHYEEQIPIYPIQLSNLIGVLCYNQYNYAKKEIKAVTLRVDDGEPCYSILAEFVEDDTIRILIGDECLTRLSEYYYDKDADYNGRDAKKYLIEWKDLNGGSFIDNLIATEFETFDGGSANLLKADNNFEKNIKDITDLRKLVFNKRKIYANIKEN